jgi:DNA-binding NarL/FixJ family response regulator
VRGLRDYEFFSHRSTFDESTDILARRTTTAPPRILLVDDEQEFLRTVTLQLEGEFDVVGTSTESTRAAALTRTLSPDVVVLDISMPVTNGIEVARCLQQLGCRSRIVFLTVNDDQDFVEAAVSAGGVGYVLKTRLLTDLIPAIWSALRGTLFISPPLRST